jgi:D-alanine-D-alanine ligase
VNKHSGPLSVGITFNIRRIDPRSGDDREAEFDKPTTIVAIADAIRELGHEVELLEARPELVRSIDPEAIDVVFNIAEGLRGRNREAQVPALLELLDIPYTGSDPAALCLTLDKGLAKRLAAAAGVPTPVAHVVGPHDRIPEDLRYPVILKPNAEGSSKGIERASVVTSESELASALLAFHRRQHGLALVEEYLTGREFTVGIVGCPPRALTPMEIVFDEQAGPYPVYTFGHKIETETGVSFACPADIDTELDEALRTTALEVFDALGCRDVARIDLRLDDAGVPNFIECNPLPGLTPGFSDLCVIAERSGISYAALVAEILGCAIARIGS